MKVDVLVPYLPDGAERTRNWTWLEQRWRAIHPTWRVIAGAPAGPFGRSRSINFLTRRATGDVWIIVDADVWIENIAEAVRLAATNSWVVPHRTIWRLSEKETVRALSGSPAEPLVPREDLQRPAYRTWPGGGCLVIEAAKWPGMDEVWPCWGAEDTGHAIALDALVGPHHIMTETLLHFWHGGPLRREHPRFPENLARLKVYEHAADHPRVLRALLDGCSTAEARRMLVKEAR